MSIETTRRHDEAALQTADAGASLVTGSHRLDESQLPTFDPLRFEEGMKKWIGSLRAQMLAEGYSSTMELMDDLRGRE